jgi:hypothetical protein
MKSIPSPCDGDVVPNKIVSQIGLFSRKNAYNYCRQPLFSEHHFTLSYGNMTFCETINLFQSIIGGVSYRLRSWHKNGIIGGTASASADDFSP